MIVIAIIISAFLASAYGALVGFGGGVFIVPILVLAFHYPIEYAVGAVALSLIPSALITTLLNNKEKHVDFLTGTILEIPTIAGVIIGSSLVAILPRIQIEYIFVIAISLVGLSFLRKKNSENTKKSFLNRINHTKPLFAKKDGEGNILYQINYILAALMGLLSGTLAGVFGVGGGFIKTPMMIKIFRIPVKIAAGTSLFMIIITSITSSVSHYFLGNIIWAYTWPVLIGFIIGPFLAAIIKKRLTSLHLEKLVGFSLLLAAMLMLVNIVFMH